MEVSCHENIKHGKNKSLGFLRRNLKAKNPQLRERAYKAIVRPQLEYAAPVWDPHHQDDILKIEMVQRRAARWVLGDYSPYSSVTDMLGKLDWRTLEQRRTDFSLVLFYKIVYGYVAVPLPTYVIPLTRTSRTSHPLAYRQLCAGTDYYKYSFYPLAVVQWNNLPVPVATLTASRKLSVRCATTNHKCTTTVFIHTFSFHHYIIH